MNPEPQHSATPPAEPQDPQVQRRKPSWLKVRIPGDANYAEVRQLLRQQALHTVCEEARCPNVGECWGRKHAAFMILGERCTRNCRFCSVKHGQPLPPDPKEAEHLAQAVVELGLRHVVITSVTRDDLPDGGAAHYAGVVDAIRATGATLSIELLVPDFRNKPGALERLLQSPPDVFNHNLETVPRLYPTVRPGADYHGSLELLARAKALVPSIFTKSGLMLGLGEQEDELEQTLRDLRRHQVDFLTLGQYLRPGPEQLEVQRWITPEDFARFAELARSLGFKMVASSPLTRSSHHADLDFQRLREQQQAPAQAR